MANRALFQVDQAKPEDQGFRGKLRKRRYDTGLCSLDYLFATGLSQILSQAEYDSHHVDTNPTTEPISKAYGGGVIETQTRQANR